MGGTFFNLRELPCAISPQECPMDELRALSAEVKSLVDRIAQDTLSFAQLEDQMLSFVEGNSFDSFVGAEAVTAKTIVEAGLVRLEATR